MSDFPNVTTSSSSSSSSSKVTGGVSLNAAIGERIEEPSVVPARKRNRSVVVSEKYSQFVEYHEGPVEFQASFMSASTLRNSYVTEAGRRMADFNVTRVARTHVRSNDVGIVAVEEPDEGEVCDMDFLSTSNLLFFEFVGSPGDLTYVKCLGYLCEMVDGPNVEHRRFAVKSPTHFLVVMGDFAVIAEKMRQDKPASHKAADQREMRDTTTAQEAGSDRTEGEEGGDYIIITRDGLSSKLWRVVL